MMGLVVGFEGIGGIVVDLRARVKLQGSSA